MEEQQRSKLPVGGSSPPRRVMPNLEQQIREKYLAMSKEKLLEMYLEAQAYGNGLCRQMADLRVHIGELREAIRPFTLEPMIPFRWYGVKGDFSGSGIKEWKAAQEAFVIPADIHAETHRVQFEAARFCITTLKKLADEGNADAAATLAEVRKVDPHI